MTTFIIGLVILIAGGLAYGKVCEKVFGQMIDQLQLLVSTTV